MAATKEIGMEKHFNKLYGWLKGNKTEAILLFTIIFIAGFFRLWRIDEYLPFLGDEGRDVRVVRRFLTEFDLMFIGPRTSIGDMYLGPLYYYLVAPFLGLFRFSPVGPAVFVAILGTVTTGFVLWVAREWFGKIAGLTSGFLFAISPLLINFSKHSWNPNIMPFFALLSIYSIWRVWQKKEFSWLLVLGISFAFVLQSHYLGLLLLPTLGIFWVITLYEIRKTPTFAKSPTLQSYGDGAASAGRQDAKRFFVFSFLSFLVFVLLMSPLFIFDAKHGWHNLGSMLKFFTERQTTVSVKPWNAIPDLWPLWGESLITRILVAKQEAIGLWASIVLLAATLVTLVSNRAKNLSQPILLLSVWALLGLMGLALYKQAIYDHYFGFLFPVPFLLTGAILQRVWDLNLRWLVVVVFVGLVWINLQENPLKYPPQRQMQRVQEIDRKIIEESGGTPFNFGLIAERNYEEGYLYFFELWGARVKEIDSQRIDETITDQLFVVCEDSPKPEKPEPCNPINHPKAEIANFGWAKIDKEWGIRGFKLFKLVHNK